MNEDIKEFVREWLQKADSDWRTVLILSAAPNCPQDTICFHCRQYVEKLLKALLTLHSVEAPKTHDIVCLLHLASPYAPQLAALDIKADRLTDGAVVYRYPGDYGHIGDQQMRELIELAKEFAAILLPLVTV